MSLAAFMVVLDSPYFSQEPEYAVHEGLLSVSVIVHVDNVLDATTRAREILVLKGLEDGADWRMTHVIDTEGNQVNV